MRPSALLVAASLLSLHGAAGQQPAAQAARPSGARRTAVIEGRCAVIVRPDDRKIARMKRAGSPQDYEAAVNDNEYYLGTSVAFLDARRVRQLGRPAHGVLVFKTLSGQYYKVSLADFDWGIILFNGRTKTVEADVTDIETSYRRYMRK